MARMARFLGAVTLCTVALSTITMAGAGAQSSTTSTSTSTSSMTTSGASTTSSPDEWATGVCTAVNTWIDSVDSTVKGLKGAGSLDAASAQAKDGVEKATNTLTSSIDALGTPSTGDGKKAKSAVDDLTDQLQQLSTSVQQLLANPGSNPVQVAGTLAEVGSDVGKAVKDVQNTATTLKGLEPKGKLRKAFTSSSSCQELKSKL